MIFLLIFLINHPELTTLRLNFQKKLLPVLKLLLGVYFTDWHFSDQDSHNNWYLSFRKKVSPMCKNV